MAGIGDRVHAVERVREVDEPVLLADRRDRLGERHPARDLLLQEEPDHLALVVGLDLLAGDHDQLAAARRLDRLQRAAEDVVVGDRDRAEPLRLGVVEQLVDLDRAVVRPGRVHVQVGDDPRRGRRAARPSRRRGTLPAAEAARRAARARAATAAKLCASRRRARLARLLRSRTSPFSASRGDRGGGELGLVAHARRIGERRARGLGLEPQRAASPSARGRRSPPRPARRARAPGVSRGADAHPVAQRARDGRAGRERLRPQQHEPPSRAARAARAATARASGQRRRGATRSRRAALRARAEELVSTPGETIR